MKKNNQVIEDLMKHPTIRSLGLTRESIISILRTYNDIALAHLLDHGQINLGNGIDIDVVPLVDRVHVIRGIAYKNHRKYKLKITMDDDIYKTVEEYYNKLREEIS